LVQQTAQILADVRKGIQASGQRIGVTVQDPRRQRAVDRLPPPVGAVIAMPSVPPRPGTLVIADEDA
jgi:hypothetical protein